MPYQAPLRDVRFLLEHVLNYDQVVAGLPAYADYDLEAVMSVLEEQAAFMSGVVAPTNRDGDRHGCQLDANGAVTTPPGFRHAYAQLVEAGWCRLSSAPAFGGLGMPQTAQAVAEEVLCASNLAFATYILLGHGVQAVLNAYGTDEQKRRYLPSLVAGQWCGTMCLTEAHCGTDLGLIRCRAEPGPSGTYQVSGQKIFITGGEHDLTDNIVHLVLAKLPDAAAGTRGISCFIVPKLRPDGSRNAVRCTSIEDKMGIHGSPTCVLEFDHAYAELVGEPETGMQSMFVMMNAARLGVGIQGLALAEAAYQQAAAYASSRRQGRSPSGVHPEADADPIIVHPDVRRSLLLCRATTEASRALALWCATSIDTAQHHPDPAERQRAEDLVSLLTPIVKAALTDHGFAASNLALGVFGGSGYIRDTGIEQTVRDARITQIYEGTNGIQALDLAGRKVRLHTGRLLRRFFCPVNAYLEAPRHDPELMELVESTRRAVARLQRVTSWIAEQSSNNDREQVAAAATDYLRLFAITIFAYLWLRMAEAGRAANRPDKEALARFYHARVVPDTAALEATILSGKSSLMALDADSF